MSLENRVKRLEETIKPKETVIRTFVDLWTLAGNDRGKAEIRPVIASYFKELYQKAIKK